MTKAKKIAIAICVLALVIGGLWLYWERPIPLGDLIPEEEWVGMDLEQMVPTNPNGDIKFEEPPMEEILTQIRILRVSRDEENRLGDDEAFRITLYKRDAWPTVIYVKSTGEVHVAADMQLDGWKYYKGAEALYVYLSNLSQTLPAVVPAE